MSSAAKHILGRVIESGPLGIRVQAPGWAGHRPGQFAMLTLNPDPHYPDPLLPRPMAVYRGKGEELEFRFKIVGRGTARLAELVPGSSIGVLGPLGNGFPDPSGSTILVGGGTGIASLYEYAKAHPDDVRVILGGRSHADILGLDDFQTLGVPLAIATDDGSLGERGLVTDLLKPDSNDSVFVCGPWPMMRAAYQIASDAGSRCLVSLEAHMACGIGICLGCVVATDQGFRYVCTHGPVFDAERVDWEHAL